MNSEIAILFRRSAIKYSFQKNLLLLCLPERIVVLEKKNSGFLWQEFLKLRFCSQYLRLNILSRRTLCFIARWKELSFLKKGFPILVARVSEIAILSIRFTIKHYFQKNSLLHCLLKRILVFEKRIPGSCGKSFWNRGSSQDTQMSDALLPPEFSLLFNLLSRTSILLERVTIKMIILIRILVLKRRICYLGNWECNLIVTRVNHSTVHYIRSRWLEIGLEIALDLWPPGHFKLGDFASRIGRSEIECSALSFSLE